MPSFNKVIINDKTKDAKNFKTIFFNLIDVIILVKVKSDYDTFSTYPKFTQLFF